MEDALILLRLGKDLERTPLQESTGSGGINPQQEP